MIRKHWALVVLAPVAALALAAGPASAWGDGTICVDGVTHTFDTEDEYYAFLDANPGAVEGTCATTTTVRVTTTPEATPSTTTTAPPATTTTAPGTTTTLPAAPTTTVAITTTTATPPAPSPPPSDAVTPLPEQPSTPSQPSSPGSPTTAPSSPTTSTSPSTEPATICVVRDGQTIRIAPSDRLASDRRCVRLPSTGTDHTSRDVAAAATLALAVGVALLFAARRCSAG